MSATDYPPVSIDRGQDEGEHATEETPTILNPEAVGDAERTPVVRMPDGLAAFIERTRCPSCGHINNQHGDDCPAGLR